MRLIQSCFYYHDYKLELCYHMPLSNLWLRAQGEKGVMHW